MNTENQLDFEVIRHTEINEIVFHISEFTCKKAHMHKDMELALVLEGRFFVRAGRESFTAAPGDILLFNPYTPHEFLSAQGLCRVMTIHIQKKFCAAYFPVFENLRFKTGRIFAIPDAGFLERLRLSVYNLGYNYYLEEFGFELRCYSDLNAIVYLLLKNVPFEILPVSPNEGSADRRFWRIMEYIGQHYQEKLTLGEIARSEGLSASYLSHFIRSRLGMSFQSYVNMLRFEHAVQLLVQTDKKLVDICLESGFSESKYFNRIFLRDYDMTPRQFRHMARNSWGSAVPDSARGDRTITGREECLAILRSYFHYTCDDPEEDDRPFYP